MAIVKHTAMNLLNQAKPNISFKDRRKRSGRNRACLKKIIRPTA